MVAQRIAPSARSVHNCPLGTNGREGGELDLSAGEIAALCAASLLAGAVDAIGGGGGLITVPALLAAGLPPHVALATNKGQSVFGSFSALTRYAHAGLVDRAAARVAFPLALGASALGAIFAMSLRASILGPTILVLLVVAALAVTFTRPREASPESVGSSRRIVVVMAVGAVLIGAYDGFFGPGAGTLWIALYVGLAGLPLARNTVARGIWLSVAGVGAMVNIGALLLASAISWLPGLRPIPPGVLSLHGAHSLLAAGMML